MSGMNIIVFVALGIVGVLLISFLISMYNRLVRLKHNVSKAWSNIDVLLKQRHDELTKLLETVKGYMKHEEGVLTAVTQARTAHLNAQTVPENARADNMMTGALKSLFAVSENYPELKADRSFVAFQGRISDLEEQISDRREFYNDSVNVFNIRIEQIPDVIMARMLGYTARDLFEAAENDRADVAISFD
jgi:LemA protein